LAEWLIEEGIGEDRAIRLDGATITDAILQWHDDLRPGQVAEAKLISRQAGSSRGVARFANAEQALVDRLPADASEGARLRLEITRAAIMENRRSKKAQARPTDRPIGAAPGLAASLREAGQDVRVVRRFPECDWDELLGEALDCRVPFPGGMLHFSPTPAMTLIDIDTADSPSRGALAAVPAIAAALRRFGLGGSIGIDFPTLAAKAERRAVDQALAAALDNWPHERTAMNGFGFVQLVARLERPSLLHVLAFRRSSAQAHQLLRQAERLDGPGVIALRAGVAFAEIYLEPEEELLAELRRRTGKAVRIEIDETLARKAPHAQLVPL
jgi:ribonuclease G